MHEHTLNAKKVKVIAHRGFSGKYPENTLLAFEKSVKIGVDEIEFDVKMTSDGHPIILHDQRLDRTTNGEGIFSEITLKDVKKLDAGSWFGKEFKGLEVPTLEEALEIIPESVDLNIHVYTDPILVEKITNILLKKERIENSYLAMDTILFQVAQKIYPRIRICNMNNKNDPWKYIEETKKRKCERLQFFTPAYKTTEDMVKKAHTCGIFVNVFYADTEKDMKRYMEFGVDAILTNYPDILLSVIKRKSKFLLTY